MIDANYLISIIVPVYNTEQYLNRCLDSIIAQDYGNFEVIIVDDGSTDGSPQIIEYYTKLNKNIRSIRQQNKGVASARNAGLNISRGDYIAFVDSDDFIYANFCSYLIQIIGNADLAVAGIEKYVDDIYVKSKKSPHTTTIDSPTAINYFLRSMYITRSACVKLYRRETLGHLRFLEGHIFEDTRYSFDVILNSKKIVLANQDLYSYRMRKGSIMTSNKALHIKDLTLAVKYIYDALQSNQIFPMCEDAFKLWVLEISMYNLNLFCSYDIECNLFKTYSQMLLQLYQQFGELKGKI